MASPQIEDGHIRIANEIAEALMRTNFSKYQGRILWAIWRKTYGWGKKEDRISNSQFVKATGIKKGHISRSLKELHLRNIVTRTGNKIGFNKDYTGWRELPRQVTPQKVTNSGQKVTSIGNKSLPVQEPQKKRKKLTKEISDLLPIQVTPKLWNEFKKHRTKLKKPLTDYAEELMAEKLTEFYTQGYDPVDLINKTIEKGWQDINPEWIYKGDKPVLKAKEYEGTPIACQECGARGVPLTQDEAGKFLCRPCYTGMSNDEVTQKIEGLVGKAFN